MDTKLSLPHPKSWPAGLLKKTFPKILRSLPGCKIIEYNIQTEHNHMVVIITPCYKVSEVIDRIKCQMPAE